MVTACRNKGSEEWTCNLKEMPSNEDTNVKEFMTRQAYDAKFRFMHVQMNMQNGMCMEHMMVQVSKDCVLSNQ